MSDIKEVHRRVAEHAAAGRGIFSVVGIKALLAELERLDRENDRLREALTTISEHQRAPEWVKRIAALGLALAKETGQ